MCCLHHWLDCCWQPILHTQFRSLIELFFDDVYLSLDVLHGCYCLLTDVRILDHAVVESVEKGFVLDKQLVFQGQFPFD